MQSAIGLFGIIAHSAINLIFNVVTIVPLPVTCVRFVETRALSLTVNQTPFNNQNSEIKLASGKGKSEKEQNAIWKSGVWNDVQEVWPKLEA